MDRQQVEQLVAGLLPAAVRALVHQRAHELPRRLAELQQALATERRQLARTVQRPEHLQAVLWKASDLAGVVRSGVEATLPGDDHFQRRAAHQQCRRRAEVTRGRRIGRSLVRDRAHRRHRRRVLDGPLVRVRLRWTLREPARFVVTGLRGDDAGGVGRAHVVHFVQPREELLLEIGGVTEGSQTKKAVFHVSDDALHAALLVSGPWRAQGRDDVVLGDQLAQKAMQDHRLHADRRDPYRTRVVEHPFAGGAPEGADARDDRAGQGLGGLVGDDPHVHEAGVLQARGEELHALWSCAGEPDLALTEVELRVLAGQAVEAHHRLLARRGPELLHERRHLAAAAGVAPRGRASQHLHRGQTLVPRRLEQQPDAHHHGVVRLRRATLAGRASARTGDDILA